MDQSTHVVKVCQRRGWGSYGPIDLQRPSGLGLRLGLGLGLGLGFLSKQKQEEGEEEEKKRGSFMPVLVFHLRLHLTVTQTPPSILTTLRLSGTKISFY